MTKISAAGGAATEFIPDIVIEMSPVKGGQIKKGDDVIGYDIAAQATKNKVTAPFVPTIISVIFGQGISTQEHLPVTGRETRYSEWFYI